MPELSADPRAEYQRRLEARRAAAAELERRHRTMGNLRLAVFAAAAVLAWLALAGDALSPWWLLVPASVFGALAVAHDRVLRRLALVRRAAAWYERALARLDDRWAGAGQTGERFADAAHPYATDLDLFGAGSLFELLCLARTRSGEEALAGWLLAPAPPDTVRARQEAVAELRPRLDLREDLAVLGEEVGPGIHPEALAAWAEAPAGLGSRRQRVAAAALAAVTVAAIVAWIATGIRFPFLLLVIVDLGVFAAYRAKVERFVGALETPSHDLMLLEQVLVRLERESFAAPRLAELRRALDIAGRPPSARIGRLRRLMELLDSRDNVFVRVIDPLVLWSLQLVFAIEAWRERSGPGVRRWLEAVGEMEALSSLAAYAYEHPADPFPEFHAGEAWFAGEGLAHPLLPEPRAVRNDLILGGELRALVVSGSNMSGKSTLLRTAGVNAVLAQAGAPVRARRLCLSPLAVGASIRIQDSLHDGTSRFYAEITRLRRIVDLTAGAAPVLFLIDEFLQGTNSHDRRIGAEAIIRGLVERGAVGMITTHDLALAHIAEALGPRGANVHFEDHLENGRLSFDYRLRPGVVRKSNALELMRSVGLEV